MRLYTTLIDWISLSTTDSTDGACLAVLNAAQGDTKPASRRQYAGDVGTSAFMGEWIDNGTKRYLYQAWGEAAHDYALHAARQCQNTRCTRIDIQYTVYQPLNYDARTMADALRTGDWRGRRRRITEIVSDDRLDTVYVGSRSSDVYTRIYTKPAMDTDTGDTRLLLRYELELKGTEADRVWRLLLHAPREESVILASELLRDMRKLPEGAVPHTRYLTGTVVPKPRGQRQCLTDDYKTLLWLAHQVEPAARRLLNNHALAGRARALIESWLGT